MKGGDATLISKLEGDQLAAVNRVLRWHGVAEVRPCALGMVLQHLTPMEMGRFEHIVKEIVAALDETKTEMAE